MKTKCNLSANMIAALATVSLFYGCNLDDELPSNELIKYNIPQEVAIEIFTPDVLKVTGSLEPFLDRVQQHNMSINQGNNVPEIFVEKFTQDGLPISKVPIRYIVENDCIYDELYPSYADSTFGDYFDSLFIIKEDEKFISYVSYNSYSDEKDPVFYNGFDKGSGIGFASGDNPKFTIFFKVENGIFGTIPYEAVWIISGEYSSDENRFSELKNVSKCMILLNKGNDPNGDMANIGTIRIFRDNGPIEGI
jgi:hypothetical protein